MSRIETARESTGQRRAVKYVSRYGSYRIETTYVNHDHKAIVCFSTQVGCPFTCTHCAVGAKGFVRNLTADEMVEQCMDVLNEEQPSAPVLFSAMGAGEPLANIDEVVEALDRLSQNGSTALSTIVPSTAALERFANK
ncbi:hypothetical protein LCGC14_3061820, partial [marine sediment metagenome]